MNENKICFISCINDPVQYNECVRYLQALEVPPEFEVEFLPVEDASSMTAGYNFAMKSSDAKFKVYLHQDVRIINKRFLYDMIELFLVNPEVGMLGVVGAEHLPINGIWWESSSLYGQVYESHTGKMSCLSFQAVEGAYQQVQALDGLILMTQYDLPWREDLYKGWHFYDLSQCVEFEKAGYRVGVPYQEKPWCLHDCGLVNVKNQFEDYRHLFVQDNRLGVAVQGHTFYRFGQGSRLESGADLFGTEGISIGDNVLIQRDSWLMLPFANFRGAPRIFIGDGCDIGRRVNISSANEVVIENQVIIAPNVHITDHNHEYESIGIPVLRQGIDSFHNRVVIGEGSWLGINTVVVGNVRIGKGCSIAANSVVTRDVPDYCVAGGSPAKVLKAWDRISGEWVKIRDDQHLQEVLRNRVEQPPLLSICIPTYRRANELEKSLRSIYSQIGNDPNFEVVVVNNDSPDHTEAVLARYKRTYTTLRSYRNETNIGPDRNVLKSLQLGRGDFLLLHGDDDYFKSGTLYRLLNVVNKHRHCGLFFLDVLRAGPQVRVGQGMDQYLAETSINATFISSLVFRREAFARIEEPDRYVGSYLNQIHLEYSVLEQNSHFCVLTGSVFEQEGNDPGGYNYGEVFIKNYLGILRTFVGRGLLEVNISVEKKKMLDSTIFYWFNYALQKGLDLDTDSFETVFVEEYQGEPYFEEAYRIIQTIRDRHQTVSSR